MIRLLATLLCLSLTATTQAALVPPSLDHSREGVDLTANFNGDAPLTYQWYRGTATTPKKVKLTTPSATTPTLVLEPPYTAGIYICEATNESGSVLSYTYKVSLTHTQSAPDMAITIKIP